ncbi:hypothetical protein MKX01_000081 [Papaver californicum]|nr:hypothetical protein MKX01_000081 [Papaver californicum]
MQGPIEGHVKRKAFSSPSDVGRGSNSRRFVGVRQRPSGRWVAEIKDSIQKDAARAYDDAARALRGPNARTNFELPMTNSFTASCCSSDKSNAAAEKCMTPFSFEDGISNKATARYEMIDGGDQLGGLLVRLFGTTSSSMRSRVMVTRLDHHTNHSKSTTSTRGRKIGRSDTGVQIFGPISYNLAVVAGPSNHRDEETTKQRNLSYSEDDNLLEAIASHGKVSGGTANGPAVHDPEELDHLMHDNDNFIHVERGRHGAGNLLQITTETEATSQDVISQQLSNGANIGRGLGHYGTWSLFEVPNHQRHLHEEYMAKFEDEENNRDVWNAIQNEVSSLLS